MATRYTGTVTIKVSYQDDAPNGQYRCVLSSPRTAPRRPEVVIVGVPRHFRNVVDSAAAYDSAAHAAVSFASEDIQACADVTAHATPEWLIHRTTRARFNRSVEHFDSEQIAKQSAFQSRTKAYQALGATDSAAEQLARAGNVTLVGRCLYTEGFGPACDLTRFAPATVRAENVLSPHAFDVFCKMVGEAIALYQKSIVDPV